MLCEGVGYPLHFELTAGQTHEAAAFNTVMVGVDEHRLDTDGTPSPNRWRWPETRPRLC